MAKILRWNPKLNASRGDKELNTIPTHLNGEGESDGTVESEGVGFFDIPLEEPDQDAAIIDEGIATDEPEFEGDLPDGATPDDEAFMDDVSSIITDDQGNEFMVEELVVVQNPDTKEVSLFMPSDVDESIPEDVDVIGKVVSASNADTLDASRRVAANCGSRHASPEENRIRKLKVDLQQMGVAHDIKDIKQDGKKGVWFAIEHNGDPYVIIAVPEEKGLSAYYATGAEDTQALLRKAASSYPTTYKNVFEFLDQF